MSSGFYKICEGVFKCDDLDTARIEYIDGVEHYRIMDLFFTELPADELNLEQVLAICHERAKDIRCSSGANKKVKSLFNSFLENDQVKNILEVGAGDSPILEAKDIQQRKISDYVISDADNTYQCVTVIFGESNQLTTYPPEHFDVVIALFVLHFKFYPSQISQIYEHLKSSGIFLANVYNRSDASRAKLVQDFRDVGFFVELMEDPKPWCKDHFYLFAAKEKDSLISNKERLSILIDQFPS